MGTKPQFWHLHVLVGATNWPCLPSCQLQLSVHSGGFLLGEFYSSAVSALHNSYLAGAATAQKMSPHSHTESAPKSWFSCFLVGTVAQPAMVQYLLMGR